jgi:hypothetical protein
VDTPLFERYIAYFEKTLGNSLFSGQMDDDTMYIGVGEWVWQEIYLRRGEWKKAFAVTQINLRYGKSRGAHQVQERFRLSDPTFCPWQPNGSGNGRLLDMMVKSFFFEYRETVTLLGAIPFAWLRESGVIRLEHIHTPRGACSLVAAMRPDGNCEVTLRAETGSALPPRIRFPDQLVVLESWCDENRIAPVDGVYESPANSSELRFVLADAESTVDFDRTPVCSAEKF